MDKAVDSETGQLLQLHTELQVPVGGLSLTLAAPQRGQAEHLLKRERVVVRVQGAQDLGHVQGSPHGVQHGGRVATRYICQGAAKTGRRLR